MYLYNFVNLANKLGTRKMIKTKKQYEYRSNKNFMTTAHFIEKSDSWSMFATPCLGNSPGFMQLEDAAYLVRLTPRNV